jgi:hypothetical protein
MTQRISYRLNSVAGLDAAFIAKKRCKYSFVFCNWGKKHAKERIKIARLLCKLLRVLFLSSAVNSAICYFHPD